MHLGLNLFAHIPTDVVWGVCSYVWMCVWIKSICLQFDLMYNMPCFYLFIFYLHQWKDAKPDELMDSKLRCVFEMPSENDRVVRGITAH